MNRFDDDRLGTSQPGHRAPETSASPDVQTEAAAEAGIRYLDDPATALEIGPDHPEDIRTLIMVLATARHDAVALEHLLSGAAPVEPPPLADDPLAVALGLTQTQQVDLSGPALRAARRKAGIKVSQLAKFVTDAGQSVRAGELQRWESTETVPIKNELLAALASALKVAVSQLSKISQVPSALAASPRFHKLVKRWSSKRNVSLTAAQSDLLAKIAAPARRGQDFDEEHVLDALTEYVEEYERRQEERP